LHGLAHISHLKHQIHRFPLADYERDSSLFLAAKPVSLRTHVVTTHRKRGCVVTTRFIRDEIPLGSRLEIFDPDGRISDGASR